MLHARKSGSPSFHSPDCRSKVRGVDAMRNLATAAPEGVKRSSGSSVRFPTTVMVVSPAIALLLAAGLVRRRLSEPPDKNERSAGLGPDDLGTQDGLVEPQLTVQLGDGLGGRLKVDDGVDALGLLVDLEREPATAPDVELLHRATRGPDHVQVLVERRGDGALLERGIEDHHEFVMTQDSLTSCGLDGHGLSVAGGLVSLAAKSRPGD